MHRYLKIYFILVKQELKRITEYKGDFIVGIIGFGLTQIFNSVFLAIIFSNIPNLKGWEYNQVIFIYGFSLLPKGIDHLLSDNLWNLGHNIVRKGEFDKYMIRPINSLFYVISEKFQVDAFGEIFTGIALLVFTMKHLNYEFSIIKVFIFVLIIPFTVLIYASIKIITAALAFWVQKSGNIIYVFYMLNDFSKYPVSIYGKPIKFLLTYIIPFSLTSYYPASYLLTGKNLHYIGWVIFTSFFLFLIAIFVWKKGIRKYESSGC